MTVSQHAPERGRSAPRRDGFLDAALDGLSRPQKSLPSRYFYDAQGSALFERITELPEYYPTRVETAILAAHAAGITAPLPPHGVLVEFGSGSSQKTELLLRSLSPTVGYAPIDVSRAALQDACARLAGRFPDLAIWPVVGDFCELAQLPGPLRAWPKLGFFPGSTIGNLIPAEAARLLSRFKALLGREGRLVIGVDLKKDPAVLERAYNDSAGVTAAFNLNLLRRFNREVAAVFDLDAFAHRACYNAREGRIEMHLVSRRDQSIEIKGHRFSLRAGETIHTENSYKYAVPEFQALARSAGWTPSSVWVDREALFSVHELI